jgi:hypothetical protein
MDLLRRFALGEIDAFKALVRQFHDRILRRGAPDRLTSLV